MRLGGYVFVTATRIPRKFLKLKLPNRAGSGMARGGDGIFWFYTIAGDNNLTGLSYPLTRANMTYLYLLGPYVAQTCARKFLQSPNGLNPHRDTWMS